MIRKKEKGNSLIINLMPIMLIFPMLMIFFFMRQSYYTKEVIQDALIESNLASAIIDLKEFGETNEALIEDTDKSVVLYRNALKGNLRLDKNFSADNAIIKGPVEITSFIIYNVDHKNRTITVYDKLAKTKKLYTDQTVFAPDGTEIKNTSIWSQIRFITNTFSNTEITAHVGELTDVAITYENLRK